jgi:pimeloyl-ACP methyl ester carboxylesterase/DNA-binding CsgD family transcriptional regulator
VDAPPVQYVTTSDGYNIAYCVSGNGRPFVFMPRPFSHLRTIWAAESNRTALLALASRFQVIRYDSRGQGMSMRGLPESHVSQDFERDLEAVVDRLRLQRFILLGALGFGSVATDFAAKHPERVEALILWNPRSGDQALDRNSPPSVLFDDLPLQDWEFYLEAMARTVYPLEDWTQAKEWLRESVNQSDREALRRTLIGFSSKESLLRVKAPALVIASRSGRLAHSTEAASKMFAATIPNARLAVFDDLGGGLFLPGPDTPPAVTLIRDFLSDLPRVDQAEAAEVGRTPPARLSTRQMQVLRLIADGKTTREIADELVLSVRTVERHSADVYAKIGARNRAEATAYALSRIAAS